MLQPMHFGGDTIQSITDRKQIGTLAILELEATSISPQRVSKYVPVAVMAARLLESQHFLLCTEWLTLVPGSRTHEPSNSLKVSHRACGTFYFSKDGLTTNSHLTIWP